MDPTRTTYRQHTTTKTAFRSKNLVMKNLKANFDLRKFYNLQDDIYDPETGKLYIKYSGIYSWCSFPEIPCTWKNVFEVCSKHYSRAFLCIGHYPRPNIYLKVKLINTTNLVWLPCRYAVYRCWDFQSTICRWEQCVQGLFMAKYGRRSQSDGWRNAGNRSSVFRYWKTSSYVAGW